MKNKQYTLESWTYDCNTPSTSLHIIEIINSHTKRIASMFRTGTSPAVWKETPDINNIKFLLKELPAQFLEDFENGIFKEFRSYKTTRGVQLDCFEDAIAFNHFHEGLYTGIILELSKSV